MNDSNDIRVGLKREWQDTGSIVQLFQKELSFYLEVIETKDPNVLMMMRRSYVRTFFAAIDAISYRLHQISLHASNAWNKLDNDEQLIIKALSISPETQKPEGLPRINNKGKPVFVKLKPSTLDHFRFSVRVFEKVHGLDSSLPELGHKDWQRLSDLVALRDRLTHPKKSDDLEIRDVEFHALRDAAGWFFEIVASRIKKARERADRDMFPQVS